MPVCKSCGEEVDELVKATQSGRVRSVCESCADELAEQEAVAEESEAAVQRMMDFKGRR